MTDRFRTAARAYLVYGAVYWIGGLYLVYHGVGVAGGMAGRRGPTLLWWAIVGLIPLLLIPYLLRHPRAWFDRWILSRRDFARALAVFLAFRAYKVGEVALRAEGASVPAPWGGVVTFQAGALVFFLVTVVTLGLVAGAAWQQE